MTTPDLARAAATVTPAAPRLRVLLWHVHGSWTDAFVRGRHHYLLPVDEERGPWGRGLAGREWPAAEEVATSEARHAEPDVVLLQRPEEVALAEQLTGLRPGRDVPAVYVEHNAPRPNPAESRHPLADRNDIPIVHVTHYNRAMWDNGIAPTDVIGHGIPDPGHRYTGALAAGVSMLNEPVRRRRIGGSDLLADLSEVAPVDVFGIGTDELGATGSLRGLGDVPPPGLHDEIARRRVYLHTARWTSLGLSLLEAMHLGMPVVVFASTAAPASVPPDAGVVSADVEALRRGYRDLLAEPDLAALSGKYAREYALRHFGLDAFLRRWESLLAEMVR